MVWIGLTSTYDDDSAWTVNIKPSYDNGLALQGYTPVQFADALPAALTDGRHSAMTTGSWKYGLRPVKATSWSRGLASAGTRTG
jgi:hypothetical protein